jgi:hypothetical protein
MRMQGLCCCFVMKADALRHSMRKNVASRHVRTRKASPSLEGALADARSGVNSDADLRTDPILLGGLHVGIVCSMQLKHIYDNTIVTHVSKWYTSIHYCTHVSQVTDSQA